MERIWNRESEFDDDGGKRRPTREHSKQFVIQAWFGRIGREAVVIQVGRKYRIEPLNPLKLKHRGRTCVILELDDDFMPDRAAVKFLEAPRSRAKVELCDLVPLVE